MSDNEFKTHPAVDGVNVANAYGSVAGGSIAVNVQAAVANSTSEIGLSAFSVITDKDGNGVISPADVRTRNGVVVPDYLLTSDGKFTGPDGRVSQLSLPATLELQGFVERIQSDGIFSTKEASGVASFMAKNFELNGGRGGR